MSIFDPSIVTSPAADDALELAEARANGFDTVEEMHYALEEEMHYALEEFSTYSAESYYQDEVA